MSSGLTFGFRRTLPHMLGVCFGFPVMLFLIGLGLGAVFTQFPWLHQVMKIGGAVFMLYLSWKIATSSTEFESNQKVSSPLTFLQAALFQWINPKVWIMSIGAVSAYTTVGSAVFAQVLLISTIFFFESFLSSSAWVLFGVALKRLLKNPTHQRYFNRAMGALLAASIVLIFIE